MILVILTDNGPIGAKGTSWAVQPGAVVSVVDDFTGQLGQPMPASNSQVASFLKPRTKP